MVNAAATADASGGGLAAAAAVTVASISETVVSAAAEVWSAPTSSLYGEPQADAAAAVLAPGVVVGMSALGCGLEEKYKGKNRSVWSTGSSSLPESSSPDGAQEPLLCVLR